MSPDDIEGFIREWSMRRQNAGLRPGQDGYVGLETWQRNRWVAAKVQLRALAERLARLEKEGDADVRAVRQSLEEDI
jgi:hypothetical protein